LPEAPVVLVIIVVDVVMALDDMVFEERFEMARDKLTGERIARRAV